MSVLSVINFLLILIIIGALYYYYIEDQLSLKSLEKNARISFNNVKDDIYQTQDKVAAEDQAIRKDVVSLTKELKTGELDVSNSLKTKSLTVSETTKLNELSVDRIIGDIRLNDGRLISKNVATFNDGLDIQGCTLQKNKDSLLAVSCPLSLSGDLVVDPNSKLVTSNVSVGEQIVLAPGMHEGQNDWLRLLNKDGTKASSGLIAGKIYIDGSTTSVGSISTRGQICINNACLSETDITKLKNLIK
jgi:uncharacterized protein YneF (UPF0154 family)